MRRAPGVTMRSRGKRLDRGECLIQVGDDVLHVLDAYRETDEVFAQVCVGQLFGRKLAVGGRRRVDDERLRIAHVGEQRVELDVVDDRQARLASALHAKDECSAVAVREQAASELVTRIVFQARVAHPAHLGVIVQEARHSERVVGVALHAQREGLEAYADELRGERA